MDKEKFIVNRMDEKVTRFIPVDCIGIVAKAQSIDRGNGKDIFAVVLTNRYGPEMQNIVFNTEKERDDRLAEVLDKISKR